MEAQVVPFGPLDGGEVLRRRREEFSTILGGAASVMKMLLDEEEKELQDPNRRVVTKKKREPRRRFHSHSAWDCIDRDHLGANPLFGKEFHLFFRLSRTRVEILLQTFGAYSETNPFYKSFRTDKFGYVGSSLEVKILLPLRVLAYGVAPHTFCDYFQVSTPMAREIYKQFVFAIPRFFQEEYLRLPTVDDLRKTVELHKRVHGVPGMLGLLDCMLTTWKNCPIGWQQSFKGRYQSFSSIVLEAASDYNLWFWHAAYGFSGVLNDGNVLTLSPLLKRMLDGSLSRLEEEAGVVPFRIDGTAQPFNNSFFLVDGIYPKYSRFVKAVQCPILEEDKKFTAWQESARKDIERAFGVLQCKFKAIALPIYFMDQKCIYNMVATCLIFHNMCVQERVMESCTERYDPLVYADPEEMETVRAIANRNVNDGYVQQIIPPLRVARDFTWDEALPVIRHRQWMELDNQDEWLRLQSALITYWSQQEAP